MTFQQKWLFFMRAIFPSWDFFTTAHAEIILEVRVKDSWILPFPKVKRSFKNLIWNAQNNLIHACNNSVIHLFEDLRSIDDPEKVEDLPSYKIVKNAVEYFLSGNRPPGAPYQFRIVVREYGEFDVDEVALVSPEYRMPS